MHDQETILPMTGIRVIEMGTLLAGPYAASLLAQFGAEVIKIEAPRHGDPLRAQGVLHEGTSLWWRSHSRNKKSLSLDLKKPQAQEIVRQLVASADIVIENFAPGTLEKWGLGWQDLSAIKPSLVMLRVSGYGQTGPYANKASSSSIAECLGGLRYTTGYKDRPPVRTGISIGDSVASLYGVIGALLALHHLQREPNKGQYIDVAMYESVFAIMEGLLPDYASSMQLRQRSGASLPGVSPSNTYLCLDQSYVVISANSDASFKRFMTVMGRQDLADDERFATNADRVTHNYFLDGIVAQWVARHDSKEIIAILDKAKVPCATLYTAEDILNDKHYRARDMIETHTLSDGTAAHMPGVVPKLSATPGKTRWLGPDLGAHNEEILAELGLTSEDCQKLKNAGVM